MNRRTTIVCTRLLAVGVVLGCSRRLKVSVELAGDGALAVLRGHTDHVRWAAFSPDDDSLRRWR